MDKHLMKKRINEVIKTDATVVEMQDFMATHVPFKKLNYYTSGIDAIKGKELSEEEFFDEFIETTEEKHNFIVVQGDNGSGKSHFIKWVMNKIESEEIFPDDVKIMLERSQNTLQATINQLINNDDIQNLLSEEEKLKLRNTGIELSGKKFISLINYNFIVECENEDEDEECELKKHQRKGLIEFLKDGVIQEKVLFNEKGPISRISSKLTNSEDNKINETDISFKAEDFNLDIDILNELKESDPNPKALRFAENLRDDKNGIRNKVAKYLNSKKNIVIQRTINFNSSDLNSILEEIRIKLKELGKNLILFIEDITSFTGFENGIIEALIHEHTEKNKMCRLFSIIGLTTGYYQSHFPDNKKDRVTGRVYISNHSLLNDNDDVLELAARYINAINVEKNEMKKWISRGAVDSDLPVKASDKEWDIYKGSQNREFALFPLTKEAILNLYNEIQEKVTPRRFIKNILLPIMLHYVNDAKFPAGLEAFEAEITIPKLKNELLNRRIDSEISDTNEQSRTKCLLRIWGDGSIDCSTYNNNQYIGNIDERIFDEFSVIKVKGNQVCKNDLIEPVVKEKKAENTANLKITKDITTTVNIPKANEIPNKEIVHIEEKKTPIKNNKFNFMETELENWFTKGENLKSHAKIRTQIISFVKEGIDWDVEDVSAYLVNEAITLNNLKIRNQQGGEERGNNIIWIEKNEEDYYFLLSLMRYVEVGDKAWNYENAQDDIVVLAKWLENNKQRIINYVLNGNDVNYDIYKYGICAEVYSVAINKTSKNINNMKLNEVYNCIMQKLDVQEEEKLNNILGSFAKTYCDKKSLINDNHTMILEYHNCPLGTGKGIFLNAYNILKTLNEVSKLNYDINEFSDISFMNDKELWKRPYELLKKVYGANLENALLGKINFINNKDKDYLESFDDIGVINNFFLTLDDNKILYPGYIKLDFEKIFDDTEKYNRYVEYRNRIKEFDKINLIDKINLLKSEVPQEYITYNNILEQVENIITKQEQEYNNRNNKGIITEEEVENIVSECLSQINEMENKLKKVEEALKC